MKFVETIRRSANFFSRKLSGTDSAEDYAQDAWFGLRKVVVQSKLKPDDPRFQAYVMQRAKYHILGAWQSRNPQIYNALRRGGQPLRERAGLQTEEGRSLADVMATDSKASPGQRLQDDDEVDHLLSPLAGHERRLAELYFRRGFTPPEIATREKIKLPDVLQTLGVGIARLRQHAGVLSGSDVSDAVLVERVQQVRTGRLFASITSAHAATGESVNLIGDDFKLSRSRTTRPTRPLAWRSVWTLSIDPIEKVTDSKAGA